MADAVKTVLFLSAITVLTKTHRRHLLDTWALSTSRMPSKSQQMAVSYDATQNLILMIGGSQDNTQLLGFNISSYDSKDPFIYFDALPLSVIAKGQTYAYSLSDNVLFVSSWPYIVEVYSDGNLFMYGSLNEYKGANSLTTNLGCLSVTDEYILWIQGFDVGILCRDTGVWCNSSSIPSLHSARYYSSCNVMNINGTNYLYVIGGQDHETMGNFLKTIEKLNISSITDGWNVLNETLVPLPIGLKGHRSVIYNSYIYIIGGFFDERIFVLDTNTDKLLSVNYSLQEALIYSGVILVNDRIYVFGGQRPLDGYSAAVDYWQYYYLKRDHDENNDIHHGVDYKSKNGDRTKAIFIILSFIIVVIIILIVIDLNHSKKTIIEKSIDDDEINEFNEAPSIRISISQHDDSINSLVNRTNDIT